MQSTTIRKKKLGGGTGKAGGKLVVSVASRNKDGGGAATPSKPAAVESLSSVKSGSLQQAAISSADRGSSLVVKDAIRPSPGVSNGHANEADGSSAEPLVVKGLATNGKLAKNKIILSSKGGTASKEARVQSSQGKLGPFVLPGASRGLAELRESLREGSAAAPQAVDLNSRLKAASLQRPRWAGASLQGDVPQNLPSELQSDPTKRSTTAQLPFGRHQKISLSTAQPLAPLITAESRFDASSQVSLAETRGSLQMPVPPVSGSQLQGVPVQTEACERIDENGALESGSVGSCEVSLAEVATNSLDSIGSVSQLQEVPVHTQAHEPIEEDRAPELKSARSSEFPITTVAADFQHTFGCGSQSQGVPMHREAWERIGENGALELGSSVSEVSLTEVSADIQDSFGSGSYWQAMPVHTEPRERIEENGSFEPGSSKFHEVPLTEVAADFQDSFSSSQTQGVPVYTEACEQMEEKDVCGVESTEFSEVPVTEVAADIQDSFTSGGQLEGVPLLTEACKPIEENSSNESGSVSFAEVPLTEVTAEIQDSSVNGGEWREVPLQLEASERIEEYGALELGPAEFSEAPLTKMAADLQNSEGGAQQTMKSLASFSMWQSTTKESWWGEFSGKQDSTVSSALWGGEEVEKPAAREFVPETVIQATDRDERHHDFWFPPVTEGEHVGDVGPFSLHGEGERSNPDFGSFVVPESYPLEQPSEIKSQLPGEIAGIPPPNSELVLQQEDIHAGNWQQNSMYAGKEVAVKEDLADGKDFWQSGVQEEWASGSFPTQEVSHIEEQQEGTPAQHDDLHAGCWQQNGMHTEEVVTATEQLADDRNFWQSEVQQEWVAESFISQKGPFIEQHQEGTTAQREDFNSGSWQQVATRTGEVATGTEHLANEISSWQSNVPKEWASESFTTQKVPHTEQHQEGTTSQQEGINAGSWQQNDMPMEHLAGGRDFGQSGVQQEWASESFPTQEVSQIEQHREEYDWQGTDSGLDQNQQWQEQNEQWQDQNQQWQDQYPGWYWDYDAQEWRQTVDQSLEPCINEASNALETGTEDLPSMSNVSHEVLQPGGMISSSEMTSHGSEWHYASAGGESENAWEGNTRENDSWDRTEESEAVSAMEHRAQQLSAFVASSMEGPAYQTAAAKVILPKNDFLVEDPKPELAETSFPAAGKTSTKGGRVEDGMFDKSAENPDSSDFEFNKEISQAPGSLMTSSLGHQMLTPLGETAQAMFQDDKSSEVGPQADAVESLEVSGGFWDELGDSAVVQSVPFSKDLAVASVPSAPSQPLATNSTAGVSGAQQLDFEFVDQSEGAVAGMEKDQQSQSLLPKDSTLFPVEKTVVEDSFAFPRESQKAFPEAFDSSADVRTSEVLHQTLGGTVTHSEDSSADQISSALAWEGGPHGDWNPGQEVQESVWTEDGRPWRSEEPQDPEESFAADGAGFSQSTSDMWAGSTESNESRWWLENSHSGALGTITEESTEKSSVDQYPGWYWDYQAQEWRQTDESYQDWNGESVPAVATETGFEEYQQWSDTSFAQNGTFQNFAQESNVAAYAESTAPAVVGTVANEYQGWSNNWQAQEIVSSETAFEQGRSAGDAGSMGSLFNPSDVKQAVELPPVQPMWDASVDSATWAGVGVGYGGKAVGLETWKQEQLPYAVSAAPSPVTFPPRTNAEAMKVSAGSPPHTLICMGFGGCLVIMKPRDPVTLHQGAEMQTMPAPQAWAPGVIRLERLSQVVQANAIGGEEGHGSLYFSSLGRQALVGPISAGSASLKDILKWLDERAVRCFEEEGLWGDGESLHLLWGLLRVACQNYGTLRSPLGLPGIAEKDETGPQAAVAKLLLAAGRENAGSDWQMKKRSKESALLQTGPSEEEREAAAMQMKSLLLSGKRKEALQVAGSAQLWGIALVLARQLGEKAYLDTIAEMAHRQFAAGSPLRTLSLLMAGRPADVFSSNAASGKGLVKPPSSGVLGEGDAALAAMLEDWQQNLAMMAVNRTAGDERVILHLGDCLWRVRGEVAAAHVCYFVADCAPENFSRTARLCLFGADHWKQPRTYACVMAIQRTEMYEYARTLGNPQHVLLAFQPYKVIYAAMLAEAGRLQEARRYCDSVTKALRTAGRSGEVEICRQAAASLEERLKGHLAGVDNGARGIIKKALDWSAGWIMGASSSSQTTSAVGPLNPAGKGSVVPAVTPTFSITTPPITNTAYAQKPEAEMTFTNVADVRGSAVESAPYWGLQGENTTHSFGGYASSIVPPASMTAQNGYAASLPSLQPPPSVPTRTTENPVQYLKLGAQTEYNNSPLFGMAPSKEGSVADLQMENRSAVQQGAQFNSSTWVESSHKLERAQMASTERQWTADGSAEAVDPIPKGDFVGNSVSALDSASDGLRANEFEQQQAEAGSSENSGGDPGDKKWASTAATIGGLLGSDFSADTEDKHQQEEALGGMSGSFSMDPFNVADAVDRPSLPARSVSEPNFSRQNKTGASPSESVTTGGGASPKQPGGGVIRSVSSWFSSIGSFARRPKGNQAKLGDSNAFYYDEKLKRWVDRTAPAEAEATVLGPPPKLPAAAAGRKESLGFPEKVDNSTAPPAINNDMPPVPPPAGLPPARRAGVRARYVDTFNKSNPATTPGTGPTSLLMPRAPSPAKPPLNFFVPAPPPPGSAAEAPAQAGGMSSGLEATLEQSNRVETNGPYVASIPTKGTEDVSDAAGEQFQNVQL